MHDSFCPTRTAQDRVPDRRHRRRGRAARRGEPDLLVGVSFFRIVLPALAVGVAVALLASQPALARDADWKLSVTIDYTSTATVTDSQCYPDPEQAAPTPVSATVTRTVSLRTVRPTTIQMYEAPNGVPATIRIGPPYKAKISETREPGLDSSGRPAGCFGGGGDRRDCGTETLRSGAYVNPLGRVHAWKGFVFEAEREPSFARCGLAPAEDKLPNPLELELKASPAALTGNRPKLVFHKSRTFKASKSEETLRSSATAKWTYTVTLAHR